MEWHGNKVSNIMRTINLIVKQAFKFVLFLNRFKCGVDKFSDFFLGVIN